MARFVILFYGVIAYLIFPFTFLYAIGFMGNLLEGLIEANIPRSQVQL